MTVSNYRALSRAIEQGDTEAFFKIFNPINSAGDLSSHHQLDLSHQALKLYRFDIFDRLYSRYLNLTEFSFDNLFETASSNNDNFRSLNHLIEVNGTPSDDIINKKLANARKEGDYDLIIFMISKFNSPTATASFLNDISPIDGVAWAQNLFPHEEIRRIISLYTGSLLNKSDIDGLLDAQNQLELSYLHLCKLLPLEYVTSIFIEQDNAIKNKLTLPVKKATL